MSRKGGSAFSMSVYLKCFCTACNQGIEYPPEMISQTVNCPDCQTALILPEQQLPKEKAGLFHGLLQKYKHAHQHSVNKKEFKRELLQAVMDGVLTENEIRMLTSQKTVLQLSD